METMNAGASQFFQKKSGWEARATVSLKGYDYKITTMKSRKGDIVCTAQRGMITESGNFTFTMYQDPNFILVSSKAIATEKNVKQVHYEGLTKLEQMSDSLEEKNEGFKVGQRFFLNGYGQDESFHEDLIIYAVVADTINYVNAEKLTLGRCEARQIRPIAKKFGIGFYYFDGDMMSDQDALYNMVLDAQQKEKHMREQAPILEAKRIEDEKQAVAQLVSENQHLEPVTFGSYVRNSIVARNVRKDLKKNFSSIIFRVTSDNSSINVFWSDGPTEEEVGKICYRYEDHVTDESGDYRDFEPTIWTKTFGGTKYMFLNRKESSIQDEPEMLEISCKAETIDQESVVNDLSDFDKTENDKAENDKNTVIEPREQPKKPYIIDHSEKAIAVFNAPEELKAVFEKHYGVFKSWLKHEADQGAWVFSKKRRIQIQMMLFSLSI